ncbi:hypothetical protein KSD_90870 [Ktedonobacter sp. SOSP1-85]|nr:hypothetical protein KSD_90870 [Ktedonobacter sp. SOSP1-85]
MLLKGAPTFFLLPGVGLTREVQPSSKRTEVGCAPVPPEWGAQGHNLPQSSCMGGGPHGLQIFEDLLGAPGIQLRAAFSEDAQGVL